MTKASITAAQFVDMSRKHKVEALVRYCKMLNSAQIENDFVKRGYKKTTAMAAISEALDDALIMVCGETKGEKGQPISIYKITPSHLKASLIFERKRGKLKTKLRSLCNDFNDVLSNDQLRKLKSILNTTT